MIVGKVPSALMAIGAAMFVGIMLAATQLSAAVEQDARKELAPTGKLRVGIAVAPTPGAGNVALDASGEPRGIGADLGRELAKKLGTTIEWVQYPNSGALTDAVTTGAWDVAFIPVDERRKEKVDFGPPHLALESTFLVRPGSAIQTLAEVDRPGVRVASVHNTATSRAAQRFLKNVKLNNVKDASELVALLSSGKA